MKTLVLVVLCASVSYAGRSENAAIDGFARGFQRAMESRQAQAQQQQQQQAPEPTSAYEAYQSSYFDAFNNYGHPAGFEFATRSACERFVQNSQTYKYCERVQR